MPKGDTISALPKSYVLTQSTTSYTFPKYFNHYLHEFG